MIPNHTMFIVEILSQKDKISWIHLFVTFEKKNPFGHGLFPEYLSIKQNNIIGSEVF